LTTEDIYDMPNGTRAELINRHIYHMAPPTRTYQKIVSKLNQYIANYIDSLNGSCEVYPEKSRIMVHHLINEDITEYTFHDSVKSGIYEDLVIDFKKFSL